MPVMSGIDTTRTIRSLESTFENHQRLPIIALTAHALSDEKQKLLQNGMDDYVTKPIQIDQIVQILTQWTTESFKKIPVLERANVIDALDRIFWIGNKACNWQPIKKIWQSICLACWSTVLKKSWMKLSN